MKVDTAQAHAQLGGIRHQVQADGEEGRKAQHQHGEAIAVHEHEIHADERQRHGDQKARQHRRTIMMGRGEDEASAQNTAAISMAVLA